MLLMSVYLIERLDSDDANVEVLAFIALQIDGSEFYSPDTSFNHFSSWKRQ